LAGNGPVVTLNGSRRSPWIFWGSIGLFIGGLQKLFLEKDLGFERAVDVLDGEGADVQVVLAAQDVEVGGLAAAAEDEAGDVLRVELVKQRATGVGGDEARRRGGEAHGR